MGDADILGFAALLFVVECYSVGIAIALSGATFRDGWEAVQESVLLKILFSIPFVTIIVWSLARPIGFMPGYLGGLIALIVLWTSRKEQHDV